MKKILGFVMMLMVHTVFAQESELVIEKKFDGVKRVLVGTSGGNISVTGGSSGGTLVKVKIRPSNYKQTVSEQELRARLENDYELKVVMVGDQLQCSAKARRKTDWKNGLSISFDLIVPTKTATDLATSGGNIVLRTMEGNQKLATSGGNLVLEKVRGNVDGQTSGGNIIAEEIYDDVELSTSGGNVKAEKGKGRINLTTSGGNVMLKDLSGTIGGTTSGGNVNAENLNGDINASTSGGNVTMDRIAGTLSASTSGGSVKVSMTEVGRSVRLSNSGGRVELTLPQGKGYDLDLRGSSVKASSLNGFSGTIKEDKVNGKINGGGAMVTVTNSGDVKLNFQ